MKETAADISSLFKEYYPRLMALACRFVDHDAAEDLVQDVFLTFQEQRKTLRINSDIAFLTKCLQNKCLNYIKHQTVVKEYEARVHIAEMRVQYLNEHHAFNKELETVMFNDLRDIIETSLSKLPDNCAEAFRLCYFDDLTHKMAARKMGLSYRTVEGYVQKALAFIKTDLKDFFLLYLLLTYIK